MRLAYIVCIFSILCFENALLQASRKKHRYKPFKTKKMRAAEVNRQLTAFQGDEDWCWRKKIIRDAVVRRAINPDLLRSGGIMRDTLLPNTPLVECVALAQTKQDLEYAEFLLKRGANACTGVNPAWMVFKIGDSCKVPLLAYAKTIEMAKLLMQYGAYHEVQSRWPKEVLNYSPSKQD